MDKKIRCAPVSAVAETVCEQAATLPDYYPPILRVVHTHCRPYVTEYGRAGETLTVSGEAAFTLLYQSDGEKGLCAFSLTLPFTQTLPLTAEGEADAFCRLTACSVRLQSARRLSLKAVFGVYGVCFGSRALPEPEKDCPDAFYLRRPAVLRIPDGCARKRFHTIERAESAGAPAAVLCADASCTYLGAMAAGGRTVIKGEIAVETLVAYPDDSVELLRFFFPVSQIADLPFSDDTELSARFTVCAVETELTANADGSKGKFEFEIDLSLFACAFHPEQGELICDAFSPAFEMELEREVLPLSRPLPAVRGRADIPLPESESGSPVAVKGTVERVEVNAGRVEGECAVLRLFADENGRITAESATVPFSVPAELPAGAFAEVVAQVRAADAGRLTLDYELRPEQREKAEILLSAKPDEAHPIHAAARPALTLYFAEKGERLWDIAKRYALSPGRIREWNGIEGEELTESRRLILPR